MAFFVPAAGPVSALRLANRPCWPGILAGVWETDRITRTMRLHQFWAAAAVAVATLTGAAFADVTVDRPDRTKNPGFAHSLEYLQSLPAPTGDSEWE